MNIANVTGTQLLQLVGAFTLLHLCARVARVLIAWFATEGKPAAFTVPVPPESLRGWNKGTVLKEPKLQDSSDPTAIRCFDPATGRSLGMKKADDPTTVLNAVARARAAQPTWSSTSFAERRRLLRSLLDFVVENQSTICCVAARDSGKTAVDALFGEILTTVERLRWTIANGEDALRPESRFPGLMMIYKNASVEYTPCGVVAALVSWNYPFHNVFGPVITGLFAGNAVVVKVSEHVAWSAQYFKAIFDEWLTANGYSKDLVQIVIGYADAGEALVRSDIDKLTFIGSAEVGKMVMKAASDNLTPCVLELGGKDFAVIRPDVEFDRTLHILMRGTFQNAGQNCVGLERIVAHVDVYDRLLEALQRQIKTIRVGAPLDEADVDCGAMILGSAQFDRLTRLINSAVASGARLVHGGTTYTHPHFPSGQYFSPTLLADVAPEMEIANEECFAPILLLMKYGTGAKDDDEDAVRVVNACRFRLGGSVFGRDVKKAEALGRKLKCGMMNINDFAASYLCNLPFGGVGYSGYGRFNGVEGLRGNCFARAVTSDAFDFCGARTAIPPLVRYPIQQSGVQFLEGLVTLVFSRTGVWRIRGLELLVGALFGKRVTLAPTKLSNVQREVKEE